MPFPALAEHGYVVPACSWLIHKHSTAIKHEFVLYYKALHSSLQEASCGRGWAIQFRSSGSKGLAFAEILTAGRMPSASPAEDSGVDYSILIYFHCRSNNSLAKLIIMEYYKESTCRKPCLSIFLMTNPF